MEQIFWGKHIETSSYTRFATRQAGELHNIAAGQVRCEFYTM